MKISFLIGGMDSGGAERVISILSNWFSARHKVNIISWNNNESFYALNENIIHQKLDLTYNNSYRNHLAFNIKRVNSLRKLLKSTKPDVLISFITPNNVLAICAAKTVGIPVIVSERGELFSADISPFWQRLRKMTYRFADALVLQTHEAKEIAIRKHLQARRNVVIANPISVDTEPIPEKEKVILFAGRLSKDKSVKDLLTAFSRLINQYPDYSLWIVGEGTEKEALMTTAVEIGIVSKTVFWGTQKDVKPFYHKASIFVLPSISEGFPNVLLEAMNYKAIVVSSNCPMGPKEIIQNGVNGFLYEPGDINQLELYLNRIMSNPPELSKLTDVALKSLDKYAIDNISQEWENIINEVKKAINKF
ncbi:glycosyltransferase family 4 protein [Mucilaginibacter agri]|uniref:Glycosyltransferase n=1 Tax=Mucilaginibacter agri TaxID=2695265 RepID=A0A966DUL6_9SPHI|nr:glycosyltransferase family 4 protein [Mucilaginibacter agri]NCD70552.1 glycosyltransferase [Mucilaginibacter agri]